MSTQQPAEEQQKYHQLKYQFNDFTNLCEKVSHRVSQNEVNTILQALWKQEFYQMMISKEFIPSGNTLAGSGPDRKLQPNCSVIGEVNDENLEQVKSRSTVLWENAIGIGFSLNTTDPVQTLEQLSQLNDSIVLLNRPKRGNMAIISLDHPKFQETISYKADNSELNSTVLYNFNISVAITDEFMNQVLMPSSECYWGNTMKSAKDWLMYISSLAWRCGDPGVVFIDRVQNSSKLATRCLGTVKASVPCGEQFLHDNETCNLGVINLNAPTLYNTETMSMNWERLGQVAKNGVRFLDNVVDLLDIPDPLMKEVSLQCRRIGLGISGWADLLKKMSVSYNSEEAFQLADKVSFFITDKAREASRELAKEKGCCMYRKDYRNISLTCVQPTGGITSVLGNEGYAIEPMFTQANSLPISDHIRMQSIWQKNIEQAISKTINMSNNVTVQQVFDAYVEAYKGNCKGVTVYRNYCRSNQPISTSNRIEQQVRCTSCEVAENGDICLK